MKKEGNILELVEYILIREVPNYIKSQKYWYYHIQDIYNYPNFKDLLIERYNNIFRYPIPYKNADEIFNLFEGEINERRKYLHM